MKKKHSYYVDIPNLDKEEWENVGIFKSRKEALKFARDKFGADKDGKISLISKTEDIDLEG